MKFVVAVDGSGASDTALSHAIDVASATGASITVVHAVDPNVYDRGGAEPVTGRSDTEQRLLVENVEAAEDRGFDILDDAASTASDRDIDVETELLYGKPVEAITEFVGGGEFDGVFIGHRGLSQRYEQYVGSVAKAVVERATVPVTVVR